MKAKLSLIIIGLVIAAALIIPGVSAANSETGNGAMSGHHYNLNLIGVKDINKYPGPADDNTNNGNRIFVPLTGRSTIKLTCSTSMNFNVIDYVANQDGALFELPAPDNMYIDGVYSEPGRYAVFVRVVGKPVEGTGYLTTCGWDPQAGEEICSLDYVTLTRQKSAAPKFTDVTKELTTVRGDVDNDDVIETVDIFDDELENYLWYYDNVGFKVVQLRFYPL